MFFRIICTFLLIVLVVTSASSAKDQTSAPLTAIQLAALSIGGDAAVAMVRKANGMTMSGELAMNGSQGNFDFCYRAPDSFYLRLTLGPVSIERWYDGFRGWQKSAGGILAAFEGRELDQFLLESRVMSLSYVRPDSKLHLFVGDKKILKNREVKELIVVNGTDSLKLYLDAKSFRPIAKLSRLDNMISDESIDSSAIRDGILLPLFSTTELRGTGIVSTTVVTSFELNQDCAVWHVIPKENVKKSIPELAESSIPFHFVDGHIYVPVTLKNGKKGVMLLDSGASSNFLLKKIVDELKIAIWAELPSRGVAGFELVGLVQLDSLLIGEKIFPTTPFGVTDIGFLNDRTIDGLPCLGILGYEFLARQVTTIDYANELLRLNTPISSIAENLIEIPFSLLLNLPIVRVSVDGHSGKFLVDLGNNGGVLLHEPFAREYNLFPQGDNQSSGITGLGGSVSSWRSLINEFRLLAADSTSQPALEVDSLEVTITSSSAGLSGSVDVDGNLGSGFLQDYLVTFDYAQNRLFLVPNRR